MRKPATGQQVPQGVLPFVTDDGLARTHQARLKAKPFPAPASLSPLFIEAGQHPHLGIRLVARLPLVGEVLRRDRRISPRAKCEASECRGKRNVGFLGRGEVRQFLSDSRDGWLAFRFRVADGLGRVGSGYHARGIGRGEPEPGERLANRRFLIPQLFKD